ncbi:MAG: SIR2 family protein [Bacteroidales bacterium]|nr:SIR2 family protein [Bacteroidales bacterium]
MEENKTVYHDPSEYIRNLQQLLVSDKKRIGFLFGAGTSLVKNLDTKKSYVPAIHEMTKNIVDGIVEEKRKKAVAEIQSEIKGENKTFTIETLLSKLELKKQVVGNGKINDLDINEFDTFIKDIKKQIHTIVSVQDKVDCTKLIHTTFAEWIQKADRKSAVEIFTTNYDYLFEVAFEYISLPYYDGFTGSYKPFFDGQSVDDICYMPKQTKLWKIHGSLGWHYDDKIGKVIRTQPNETDILIYPSTLKYDQSRKQPYTALGDRLSNFIKQDDTVLIICGYSFGDEHINERINTALSMNPLGHVYVLLYDISWDKDEAGKDVKNYSFSEDTALAKMAISNSKISVFASRSAVIGGVYGNWKLKREPDKDDSINIDKYFDEDACASTEDKKGKEITQSWTGEGELIIPDFSKFVAFLKSMIISK